MSVIWGNSRRLNFGKLGIFLTMFAIGVGFWWLLIWSVVRHWRP